MSTRIASIRIVCGATTSSRECFASPQGCCFTGWKAKGIVTTLRVDEPQCVPWLVLRTRGHHENVVVRSLQQKEINSYLPRHHVVSRSKNRGGTLEVPLF